MQFIRTTAIIILIKLNTFSAVYSQRPSRIDNDKVFNASRFGHGYITLSYKGEYLLQLQSFKDIAVIDARPDTFAIGFRKRDIEIRKKLLRFEKGLSHQLSGYLRNNSLLSKDTNACSLIIVVRDLWLKEYDVDENENDNIQSDPSDEINFRKSYIRLGFDCYLHKNDAYYAIFRFDTLVSKFHNLPAFSDKYIEYTLTMGLIKAENLNTDSIAAKKRKFSLEEMNAYYKKRWDIPILAETSLRKGVYTNFEEFKTNQPSITNFELKKGKLADVLFADGKPMRNAWGYCDGDMIFIKTGENYYPLILQEHSFYFLGSTELNRTKGHYDNNNPSGYHSNIYMQTRFKNVLLPMKLNWQTGKPY